MRRPRMVDLFCKAGGAAKGYHDAGFEVIGVDLEPQPNYPFQFVEGDALTFSLAGFDAVHASPPCQFWSTQTADPSAHLDLIPATRALLEASGLPYVIENVEGARRALPQSGSPVRLEFRS